MKAVVFAGGYGTRISEESAVRPKPMVEIGGRPILWHIMNIYARSGIDDFVIAAGYRGHVIREYFANYFLYASDATFRLDTGERTIHRTEAEAWNVTVVETGEDTMTGGRLLRLREYLDDETFCLTYGDCVTDLDVGAEIEFHRSSGALVTVTAIRPPGRFGVLTMEGEKVTAFHEKPAGEGGWVNGGFFVVEPEALDYIPGDATSWEGEPLERIADEGRLLAYRHPGFWHPMDTLRDKMVLEELWASGAAPWKLW